LPHKIHRLDNFAQEIPPGEILEGFVAGSQQRRDGIVEEVFAPGFHELGNRIILPAVILGGLSANYHKDTKARRNQAAKKVFFVPLCLRGSNAFHFFLSHPHHAS
jgi:hypothetical protein